MNKRISSLLLSATVVLAFAVSAGGAMAQSQPSNQQPPAQPQQSGAGSDTSQRSGNNSMPMKGMEHGHKGEEMGQKMMKDHGDMKKHGNMGQGPSDKK
ncbi:MAG: hypothetical protein JHD07_02060 [Bradyrhizobium sp.]|jgi:hypothetical protein|uniref:hypothetical protein n=1 Tax=Bradyrhizobium sp. TaxID=376 RepID=UPI001A2B7323|nr:hypothetical protein [Bradyrhizobium sp.]MBJ7402136.1 hypothetical protein [Bradyrhizobium sp.]